MDNREIVRNAVINSFATAIYVIIIALLLSFIERGIFRVEESIFTPIIMLMLFVFSAGLTGFLVFGKPLTLYLDNKKKEALLLIRYTFFILLFTLLFLSLVIFFF